MENTAELMTREQAAEILSQRRPGGMSLTDYAHMIDDYEMEGQGDEFTRDERQASYLWCRLCW